MEMMPSRLSIMRSKLTAFFVKKSEISAKTEINLKSLRALSLSFFFIFVTVVMLMPDEEPGEFVATSPPTEEESSVVSESPRGPVPGARSLWAAREPRPQFGAATESTQSQNTSMVLNSKSNNARVQIRAGIRLPLRIMDKFIVSQEPVPVLAELILDAVTDSGLRLPAGTRFYGEAGFQGAAERASIHFRQISLPTGEIRPISGIAVGKDGQTGVPGRVFSDGMRNTAGSVITTFVGGLAAGSVETDAMGQSRGGVENGLLTAIAATAKERAQAYGEKMKTEREWIEVEGGAECDALLSESFNLLPGETE